MQLFLVFSIVQLVHNSLHTTLALFCELYVWQRFTPGSHIYSVCSVYAVYVRYISSAEAAQTQCAFTQDPWLYTPNTTFIHYFDFKSKYCY